jgi:apoptosis-inducing factor 2
LPPRLCRRPKAGKKTYKVKTGNLMMAMSLGSRSGIAFVPPIGMIRSAWLNRKVKAETMLIPKYRNKFLIP